MQYLCVSDFLSFYHPYSIYIFLPTRDVDGVRVEDITSIDVRNFYHQLLEISIGYILNTVSSGLV